MKKIFFFASLMFLVVSCLLFIGSYASASETTLYFGSTEKTYDNLGKLTQTKTYLSAGSATVVRTTNNQQPTNNKTEYLYSDHLGSTVLVTKADGTKEATLQYYPFGSISNQQLAIGKLNSDKLYTNQRLDFSSDLYFYNARYYNPQTGNFISADKAQGPNRYSYVKNNPVLSFDPTGQISVDELKNLVERCNNAWSSKQKIEVIIISPNSDNPPIREIYQFMLNHGFGGMTHEDMPLTRSFSCYPNCQFWREDLLPNYSSNLAESLFWHEVTHNDQNFYDPKLAEHFRGETGKGQNETNRGYMSLLEGWAESRNKSVGKGAYVQYKNFYNILDKWVGKHDFYNNQTSENNRKYNQILRNVGIEVGGDKMEYYNTRMDIFNIFYDAIYGNWEQYSRFTKIYDQYEGQGAFEKLLKQTVTLSS